MGSVDNTVQVARQEAQDFSLMAMGGADHKGEIVAFADALLQQVDAPYEFDPSALADEAIASAREAALGMCDFADEAAGEAQQVVDYYAEGCPGPTSMNGVDRVGRVVTAVLCSSPGIENHDFMHTTSVAVRRDS